ncbi:serine protease [Phyllobacterium zundukense]|uniref:Uncharacterized protein n=1 Tax=Phyllobacterium zundukense TaxID=1867719 RepID=A0A2N9VPE8_9HYPH|nr:serine protease [Phyllobacterium zundukense]ATU94840.1 hypothetical protein BLM14_24175 [Phyllobacterium zundukense]PIO41366.1 hypothetical protein B5P45_28660 [Phyllobacterium zundukense]
MAKKSRDLQITRIERTGLYAARQFLDSALEEALLLRIPFDFYFQDPLVAAENPKLAFDEDAFVPWEPGIGDGPTSARFVIVDYDGGTETLVPPARWDEKASAFVDTKGKALNRTNKESLQFHQVNVWAVLQRALDFFENGFGLGRRILWGFEGSRLIVVPHAGYGENAFYDRQSKSLQFYYFDRDKERIFTCLSADIINHEFGHAVLDGIRPHFIESVLPETAAFHEFMGDLTAILIAFRNNAFRQQLIAETKGNLESESTLSKLAEQFGKHVTDKPYLRSARNNLTYKDIANDQRPHYMSQVLTGAMFDIILRLSKYYVVKRNRTVPQAFWDTIQRMQHMAIQPLDLLPPVDVTFRDYVLAVLRAEEIANPTDPDGYRGMMLDVFERRGLISASEVTELKASRHIFDRLQLEVFHDIDTIASSRADAYRFLDDNRKALFIPYTADITVSDLCTAQKLTRQARRQPKQVLLQYIWREDLVLKGAQFGQFNGKIASLLCGGTLAFDENGNVLAWARKPGTLPLAGTGKAVIEEAIEGKKRHDAFLAALVQRIMAGRIGTAIGGERGLLAKSVPPLTSRVVDGTVRFELSPHLGIHDDEHDVLGGRPWQISS